MPKGRLPPHTLTLRLPGELHRRVKAIADSERRTMTSQLILLIERNHEMQTFNDRKPYHGSAEVQDGKLRGATDRTDYFYLLCPKCPDERILRILEYGVHDQRTENEYNDECSSKAKYGFTLAFKIHCENCGFGDFVKLSNTGWQGGRHADALGR